MHADKAATSEQTFELCAYVDSFVLIPPLDKLLTQLHQIMKGEFPTLSVRVLIW